MLSTCKECIGITPTRLPFGAWPEFATDEWGRISNFIISLSRTPYMGRAFILVLQHKDINSSQSVERLKVKTTSLLEKAMSLSVYEFMVLLLHRLVGECE